MRQFLPSKHGILVPKYIEGQLDTPSVGVCGYVKWELRRGGKVIRDSGGFHKNLITTKGMDLMATNTPNTLTSNAGVGSGATAPTNADTNLQAQVGTNVGRSATLANAYVAGPPDYWYRQYQYKFLEANANGNLSEFATFGDAGNTKIFARQLLKDNLGNPTVITKTNLDQLWITYEVRVYPPTADVNSVVTISGVNYDVTTRPMQVSAANAWGYWLQNGPLTAFRAGSKESNALLLRTAASNFLDSEASQVSQTAYVAGSFYLETQALWDLTQGNYPSGIGGIGSYYGSDFGYAASYQMFQQVFPTTKIPKTNTKKLTLFMRKGWARYP